MLDRLKVILFIAILSGAMIGKVSAQQASRYTQYMNNLTLLNPAYSLVDNVGSVTTLVRKQLVGINGAPATYAINGNIPLASMGGATGLIVQNDEIAVEHQLQVNAYLSKSVQLSDGQFLGVSINAGIKNYRANYSSLDNSDPLFRDDVRETRPNIGFGVMYYTRNYYLGLSAPELTIRSLGNASVETGSNFNSHYYFSGAYLVEMADDITFKPATLVAFTKGQSTLANISGMFYLKEVLGIGANYCTNKQAAGILSINTANVRIGYSYQFASSSGSLNAVNSATHEVTLSYRFGKNLSSRML